MKDDRMGIVMEGPSGDGKQLLFDVIARNWSLEECKEWSDRVKINPENNSLLKTHDMMNYVNAWHPHIVATRSLTGISLLGFGNLVGHMLVFFVFWIAINQISKTTERQGRSCLCTVALTVGSQHVWKSRRNKDVTAAASLKLLQLMSALL